jgi:hypothetical protein
MREVNSQSINNSICFLSPNPNQNIIIVYEKSANWQTRREANSQSINNSICVLSPNPNQNIIIVYCVSEDMQPIGVQ